MPLTDTQKDIYLFIPVRGEACSAGGSVSLTMFIGSSQAVNEQCHSPGRR